MMRSHPPLIPLSRSSRILLHVRRLALIAVGAAVAAILLLPAAAAWLREPNPQPLPQPVDLQRSSVNEQPHIRVNGRWRSRPRLGARPLQRIARPVQRAAAAGARPINLAPAPPAPAAPVRASGVDADDEDDQQLDEADDGGDGDGDDELRDG
jgi:hypothetical protein